MGGGYDPRRHNYYAPMMAMAQRGAPGEVRHVHVFHDEHCAIYSGGYCDCDPVVSEPTTETDADKVWRMMNASGSNP